MIFEILHSYVGNEINKEKEAVSVMIWVRSEAWFIGNGANMYYLRKSMHNRSAIKIQVFPFKRHRNRTLGKIHTYMTPKLASYWLDKNKPLSLNFLCIENVSCTKCTLQYPQGVPSRLSPIPASWSHVKIWPIRGNMRGLHAFYNLWSSLTTKVYGFRRSKPKFLSSV